MNKIHKYIHVRLNIKSIKHFYFVGYVMADVISEETCLIPHVSEHQALCRYVEAKPFSLQMTSFPRTLIVRLMWNCQDGTKSISYCCITTLLKTKSTFSIYIYTNIWPFVLSASSFIDWLNVWTVPQMSIIIISNSTWSILIQLIRIKLSGDNLT